MARDYLAIVGGSREDREIFAAASRSPIDESGLQPQLATETLTVWASENLPVRFLPDRRGLILGAIFEAGVDAAPAAQGRSATDGVLLSSAAARAELLADTHWGSYVAILSGEGERVDVIRDPMAGLPCYYLRVGQLTIITSDAALPYRLTLTKAQINWPQVIRHLARDQLRESSTCITGLKELLGGFRLTIESNRLALFQLWDPWHFTEDIRAIDDEDLAISSLRQTLIDCVSALASQDEHILLEVSGGLDSSILAACLSEADAPYSCITFVTEDPRGDERLYAQAVCQRFGVDLFERWERVASVDITASAAAHLPRPISRSFAQSGDRNALDVAAEVNATAFYSGAGGDNVFCLLQSAAPVADRISRTGFSRASWRTARDMAGIVDRPTGEVFLKGVRRYLRGQRAYRWPSDTAFLSREAVSQIGEPDHPWLIPPNSAVPGKSAHIAWLLGIQNHLEGFGRERVHPVISPLMSQPLVECCLRIPTWLWCSNGVDRSIARSAFRNELPESVIARRIKGTPGGFVAAIFEANRGKIRDLLLSGHLASHHVLDVAKLDQALNVDGPVTGLSYMRIMALVDVEAWLDAWTNR